VTSDELRAWIVAADMGLGHQRAAHALAHLAHEGILIAGDPRTTDEEEARLWRRFRWTYEFVSRAKDVPLVGGAMFAVLDSLLQIPPFYPLRDRSKPALNNWIVERLMRQGLGRSVLARLRTRRLPVVTTFYAPALVADRAHCAPVYCGICDADLNRVWVASDPAQSHVLYLAPCGRVMRRLRQYGVPDDAIFITGFPLPRGNVGGPGMETLKTDLLRRLGRIDPRGRFRSVYGATVREMLGGDPPPADRGARVTVTFAVGGAGAQTEIGVALARSLRPGILDGRFRLALVAGVNPEVEQLFRETTVRLGLGDALGHGLLVVREETKAAYFDRFNALLRETDVLWTKPSELSFYSALGLPIVMAPPIGAHEVKNLRWLTDKGAGLPQDDPELALEWLGDLLRDGVLAERAFSGFVKNRKLGVYKIEEVLRTGTMTRETHPLRR
jgi:hypothetical protein